MSERDIFMQLFNISVNTYYLWKKQERPIVKLLEKYFLKEELEEFLNTGKILKYENSKYIVDNFINSNKRIYIDSFTKNYRYGSLDLSHNIFKDFYFNFLISLKDEEYIKEAGIQQILFSSMYKYLSDKIQNQIDFKKIEEERLVYQAEEQEEIDSHLFKSIEIDNLFKKNAQSEKDLSLHLIFLKDWTDDISVFLDYVQKDDFEYFIKSGDDELLYHAIGYHTYNLLKDMSVINKLDLISTVRDYFQQNKIERTKENLIEQIKVQSVSPVFQRQFE